MEYIEIGELKVSRIAYGAMRISTLKVDEVSKIIHYLLDNGVNFFDHADIYGQGKSEAIFGEVLKNEPSLRKQMIIQTKCGICSGYYDFSYDHIISSVNESLTRLNTNYIDILLLHRPDVLMDVDELAKALIKLYKEGKVKYFGVSNMSKEQINLISSRLPFKLVADQVQFSIVHSNLIDNELSFNMKSKESYDTTLGLYSFAYQHNIALQAWSPLMASWEEGSLIDNPNYPKLNEELEILAKKYNVDKSTISIAFVLTLKGMSQAIIGSTKLEHIASLIKATDVKLTKKEWYTLYISSGKKLP